MGDQFDKSDTPLWMYIKHPDHTAIGCKCSEPCALMSSRGKMVPAVNGNMLDTNASGKHSIQMREKSRRGQLEKRRAQNYGNTR